MSDVKAMIQKMIAAPSCCHELKATAMAYLNSMGGAHEYDSRAALLAEIKEDVVSIDGLIEFLESDHGREVLGDQAVPMLERAKKEKAAGEKYCFCDACRAALAVREILEKH